MIINIGKDLKVTKLYVECQIGTITTAIESAIKLSKAENLPVQLGFNNFSLAITPKSTVVETLKIWKKLNPSSNESIEELLNFK